MKSEYIALRTMEQSQGYKVLQALWAHQHGEIVKAIRKAGKKGQDSSWRYWAGQQEGFEIAITQLERALTEMQKNDETLEETKGNEQMIEELIQNLKGEKQ